MTDRLVMTNREQLHLWMHERRNLGHDIVAIKGPAPKGMLYSDGEQVEGLVNIAWKDVETGEIFSIERDWENRYD